MYFNIIIGWQWRTYCHNCLTLLPYVGGRTLEGSEHECEWCGR